MHEESLTEVSIEVVETEQSTSTALVPFSYASPFADGLRLGERMFTLFEQRVIMVICFLSFFLKKTPSSATRVVTRWKRRH